MGGFINSSGLEKSKVRWALSVYGKQKRQGAIPFTSFDHHQQEIVYDEAVFLDFSSGD